MNPTKTKDSRQRLGQQGNIQKESHRTQELLAYMEDVPKGSSPLASRGLDQNPARKTVSPTQAISRCLV